ncbi:MAG TPA: hypothetical protein VEC35_01390 [Noviherbaspirillum sp.]|nr:hypothetical protein [Noviherbaspirillum sp.]
MSKLLVNSPIGTQEVIEIGEGGGYFDQSRVLWDERKDGPLPEITLGGMVRQGSSLVFSQIRMDEHNAALQPTQEQLIKHYDGVVQKRLDDVARLFGYGDPNRPEVSPILHAISYAEEPAVPRFQNEGRALRAWRSLVWNTAAGILNAVKAHQRAIPTEEELLAEIEAAAPAPEQEPL